MRGCPVAEPSRHFNDALFAHALLRGLIVLAGVTTEKCTEGENGGGVYKGTRLVIGTTQLSRPCLLTPRE